MGQAFGRQLFFHPIGYFVLAVDVLAAPEG
jgi:hypothetical protein